MSVALRCGSEQRSRYMPSRFSSVSIFSWSMRSLPTGVVRRYRFSPGLSAISPRSLPHLKSLSWSDPSMRSASWATSCPRMCLSRSAAPGLWQITNRPVSLMRTSLTRMVPGDLGVAALPGQGCLYLRGAREPSRHGRSRCAPGYTRQHQLSLSWQQIDTTLEIGHLRSQ